VQTRDPDQKAVPDGRRFPDLFEKALQGKGSPLASKVTVVYDGEERRKQPRLPNDVVAAQMGAVVDSITPNPPTPVPAGAASSLGPTGVSFGAPAHATKRRWRKGR
jgi:hypothetical protein